jgi:hypothetical protein
MLLDEGRVLVDVNDGICIKFALLSIAALIVSSRTVREISLTGGFYEFHFIAKALWQTRHQCQAGR